ncbi:MAG: NAD(P)H-quinone oxidoreductase [Casimicrobium sp.]
MPTLPTIMKAIEHGAGGDPSCMRLIDTPVPTPAADEVLIKVHAAGVNRPDVLQRSGKYPPPADASPYMGLEVSGEIVALGKEAARWKVGDTVCALTPGGGYAEYCVTPAAHCLPIPSGLTITEAAAIPETFFTVWANVFLRANFKGGESILIHGGSSGIGSTAIQLCKAFAATDIIVTCGDQTKIDYAIKIGADHGINYKTEDFAEQVKTLTEGRGVDVVLDMVGAPYFQKNLDVCAIEGRIAQVAYQHGSKAELNLQALMMKRLTWTGSTLRARPKHAKAEIATSLEQNVWQLFEEDVNALRPHIHVTFPLAKVADAHRMMEAGEHLGKIVLLVA